MFNVVAERTLSNDTEGICLVGGHSLKRVQLISRFGPQICYNGDIGAGVYLADEPWLAAEYSKLHGARGIQELIAYGVVADNTFRLPRQRAEFES